MTCVERVIYILTTAKTIGKKISVKASASKPPGKPPPGDKNVGLDTPTCFYAIEDGDETEEGEESEIIVIATKASRQLIKTYINHSNRGIRIWLIKYLKCRV